MYRLMNLFKVFFVKMIEWCDMWQSRCVTIGVREVRTDHSLVRLSNCLCNPGWADDVSPTTLSSLPFKVIPQSDPLLPYSQNGLALLIIRRNVVPTYKSGATEHSLKASLLQPPPKQSNNSHHDYYHLCSRPLRLRSPYRSGVKLVDNVADVPCGKTEETGPNPLPPT